MKITKEKKNKIMTIEKTETIKQQLQKLNQNHSLYLITIELPKIDKWCKIGITGADLESRIETYRKQGYIVEIIRVINSTGTNIRAIESLLQERGLDGKQRKRFPAYFRIDGYTECYNLEYMPEIQDIFGIIQREVTKKNNAIIFPQKLGN